MPQLMAAESAVDGENQPDLLTAGWLGLLSGSSRLQLEAALPAWLPRQRWFGAKSRRIQSCRVVYWVDLSQSGEKAAPGSARHTAARAISPAIFFIEVDFFDGEPSVYQVPLTLSTGSDADEISTKYADSIVTTVTSSSGLAVLHDAFVLEDFREALLAMIEHNISLAPSSALMRNTASSDAAESEHTNGGVEWVSAGNSTATAVAPKPLTAQPGEAASVSRSDAATIASASAQRKGPDESPSAGGDGSFAGRLVGQASKAFTDAHRANRRPSRTGSAEQSNTSIIYGDKLILKFFRRLEPGENPDVEIGRFLTEVAHYPRIAPFLGEISLFPESHEKITVAVLQGLVTKSRDGWEWFLEEVAGFLGRATDIPEPPELPAPSFAGERESSLDVPDAARPSLEAAALLGRRTAEMHLALSSSTREAAFAPEPFHKEDLEQDAQRIQAQVSASMEALKQRLSALDEPTTDAAGLLISKRRELIARSRSIILSGVGGQRIRIHGDFHLGQTLRVGDEKDSGGDFVFLDFEGEPARPFEERRRKQSPLRDVAGMLRSFSYVAHAGLRRFLDLGSGVELTPDIDRPVAWARAWQGLASAEFIGAYRETIAANAALLPPPPQTQILLDAYLLEKALYELLYELNHRPSWLQIPIAGILSLLK